MAKLDSFLEDVTEPELFIHRLDDFIYQCAREVDDAGSTSCFCVFLRPFSGSVFSQVFPSIFDIITEWKTSRGKTLKF